jgi:hypothetical protein
MGDVTETGCLGVVVMASSWKVTTFIVIPLHCRYRAINITVPNVYCFNIT